MRSASFTLTTGVDDQHERRQANRAIGVSALGLAVTGLVELSIGPPYEHEPTVVASIPYRLR